MTRITKGEKKTGLPGCTLSSMHLLQFVALPKGWKLVWSQSEEEKMRKQRKKRDEKLEIYKDKVGWLFDCLFVCPCCWPLFLVSFIMFCLVLVGSLCLGEVWWARRFPEDIFVETMLESVPSKASGNREGKGSHQASFLGVMRWWWLSGSFSVKKLWMCDVKRVGGHTKKCEKNRR